MNVERRISRDACANHVGRGLIVVVPVDVRRTVAVPMNVDVRCERPARHSDMKPIILGIVGMLAGVIMLSVAVMMVAVQTMAVSMGAY
jgi:hypothetical protein